MKLPKRVSPAAPAGLLVRFPLTRNIAFHDAEETKHEWGDNKPATR